jgi:hypothetical protein
MFKLFFIAALLIGALGVAVSSIAQQALADKVGPNPETENNVKQGALGEFFSKEGRDYYADGQVGGATTSGREHGQATQNYARPGDHVGGHETFPLENPGGVNNLGENYAYYASGECREPPCE